MVQSKKMTLKSKRKRTTERLNSNKKSKNREAEQHETCVIKITFYDANDDCPNNNNNIIIKNSQMDIFFYATQC